MSDFALTFEDKITLREANANPCSSFDELYADCELNSDYHERLQGKMMKDLQLLETEMFSVIQKAEELVKELEKEIDEAINDTEVEQTEKDRFKDYLVILQETRSLFADLIQHFTKTKAVQEHLHPVLNMGGYRSLIVCTIDTLTIIIKSLEKSAPDTSLAAISRFVWSLLSDE